MKARGGFATGACCRAAAYVMTRNMHARLPRVITSPATSEIVMIPKGTSAFKIDPIPGTAFSGGIMSMGRAEIELSRRWSAW
jgi:hypothetical protein